MNPAVRLMVYASCLLMLVSTDEAHAQALPPQKVLFVSINGNYNADGVNFYNTVAAAAGAANTTYILLSSNGQVANALAANTYDQIWVYDLSVGADNYPSDYAAIVNWYNNHPSKHIICDGRIISSYWNTRHTGEGAKLSQNYFHNLALRKGGLVLTTDHNTFQTGINSINTGIGIQPFSGNFSLDFIPVDTANVLMTTPNNMGSQLYDDSSPGQTPFGLQPNGKVLYTLAWHSGNTLTPGISTTIQGALGVQGAIAGVSPGALLCGETTALNLTATATNGIPPYTFSWRVSPGGQLGT
ncbi:MAG TPA: hypothetical protein PK095_09455, partial [Myxococcota bacterium]|nr:hypothetical protein [Myxococcota bacterium]